MTGKEVYVPKTDKEKQRQRALLQYFKPENRRTVIEALEEIRRTDLIGNGPNCLVAPDREYIKKQNEKKSAESSKGGSRYSRAAKPAKGKGDRRR